MADTFVLLHGMNDAPSGIERIRRKLAVHGATLAPAYLGHAGRPLPDVYTFEAIVVDIIAQIEAQGLTRCHIVGHSFGGLVARRVAELRPDLIATLTEIASPARPDRAALTYSLRALDPAKAHLQGPMHHRILARRHRPTDWRELALANMALVRGMRGAYWHKRIDVTVPSLIISAVDDPYGDPRGCVARGRLFRDVRVMLLTGTLHPFSADQDDAMIDAVVRMRDGLLPPSGPRFVGAAIDPRWITGAALIGGNATIHTHAIRLGKLTAKLRRAAETWTNGAAAQCTPRIRYEISASELSGTVLTQAA